MSLRFKDSIAIHWMAAFGKLSKITSAPFVKASMMVGENRWYTALLVPFQTCQLWKMGSIPVMARNMSINTHSLASLVVLDPSEEDLNQYSQDDADRVGVSPRDHPEHEEPPRDQDVGDHIENRHRCKEEGRR